MTSMINCDKSKALAGDIHSCINWQYFHSGFSDQEVLQGMGHWTWRQLLESEESIMPPLALSLFAFPLFLKKKGFDLEFAKERIEPLMASYL